MKSSRHIRLALLLLAALWLAPFAAAQSGGQDGPLASERVEDNTKGPEKGDAWMPKDRTGAPPPPDDRGHDDDGTVDPDGASGDEGEGEEKDGTGVATSVHLDGSWEVHADGSATVRLTFFGPDTLARLGVLQEGRFFDLALVPATTKGSRMTLFLTPEHARAFAQVTFVLEPLAETPAGPSSGPSTRAQARAEARSGSEAPATKAPRPVAVQRARRG